MQQGDIQAALDSYNQAVALAPIHSFVYYNRAIARGRSGDWRGTVADYTEALKLQPKYALALRNRSRAY